MSAPRTAAITNLWLDVTFMPHCNAHKTGIPRTVTQIARAWTDQGVLPVRFCQFQPHLDGYVEIPAQQWLNPPPTSAVLPEPRRSALRKLKGALGASLPGPIYGALRFAGRPVLTTLRRLRSRMHRPQPTEPTIEFTPSDLLCIMGANWVVEGGSQWLRREAAEKKFRTVILIYDMIPYFAPQFCSVVNVHMDWQTNAITVADLVVTISEHARADVQEFCRLANLPCPPTETIRLGDDLPHLPAVPAQVSIPGLPPGAPFVLAVGTIEARKNHQVLYHVWRRLRQEEGDQVPHLVIVGGIGCFSSDILHLMTADPLTRDKILTLTKVEDAQLAWLYRNCLFTMYPSLYEGWGLPVAESLAYGKYCIASNATSIPEIAPTLVGMHDPCDWKECLRLVREAIDTPGFLAGREREIRSRYQRTSWRDCAGRFSQLLEKYFGGFSVSPQTAPPACRNESAPAANALAGHHRKSA